MWKLCLFGRASSQKASSFFKWRDNGQMVFNLICTREEVSMGLSFSSTKRKRNYVLTGKSIKKDQPLYRNRKKRSFNQWRKNEENPQTSLRQMTLTDKILEERVEVMTEENKFSALMKKRQSSSCSPKFKNIGRLSENKSSLDREVNSFLVL